MDLPCPQWVRHVEHKWTKLGPEGRKRFSLLTDTNDIFNNGLSLTHPDDLNTLSIISEKYCVKKSPERAFGFREQGNLSFKVKDYTTAALFYSEGICHAEKNTEQLSVCYANRSAALFYLKLYKECLEDIRRALEAGYPCHLRDKLTTRKTACLNQLSELEKSNTPAPNNQPQSQKRSDSIGCSSHGVSVYYSPEKGRHLLATENKPAGEVVLVDEAYSCVLIPGIKSETKKTAKIVFDTEDRHCHHCLSQTLSSVPCPNCSYARYCDERCQKDAWSRWHQWECAIGSDLLVFGVLAHLALRVALRAGRKEVKNATESSCVMDNQAGPYKNYSQVQLNYEGNCTKSSHHRDCYHGNSYLGIYSLLPHVGEHSPSLRFLLAVTTATLYKKMQGGPPPDMWASCEDDQGAWKPEMSMLGVTALRHLMQLRCNAQAITAVRVTEELGTSVQSSREIRIGTAIFPILSLLNHSCSANTSIFFTTGFKRNHLSQFSGSEDQGKRSGTFHSGVTVTVCTSKDLKAGQEILHCYGPHCSRTNVKERQRLLLEQYFFTCDCVACQRERTENDTNADVNTGLKCVKCEQLLQAYVGRYVCSRPSCGLQITSAEVQKRLQDLQNSLDQAFHLLERERSDKALRILKSASSHANSILTETHPVQGELADATARAYATNGDWSRAASHLKRSIVAITAQFGEDSVELGRQFFKLAQLHFNGGDRGAALSVIPKARRLLSLHCGPHCEELQELQEIECCLK